MLIVILYTFAVPANVANLNEETASLVTAETVQYCFMGISHIAKAAASISVGH